jgi:hypothetical protein
LLEGVQTSFKKPRWDRIGRTDHDVLNGGPAHDRLMFAVAGRDARFVSR